MRRREWLLFFFWLMTTPIEASDVRRVETWLISGQSNAVGYAEALGPESPAANVLMYDVRSADDTMSGGWMPARDPLPFMGSSGVGPWVEAAKEVAARGYTVRLTGCAWTGKRIDYWEPGQPGHSILMKRTRRTALGGKIFIWYQGEGDANQWVGMEEYLRKLKAHVARVRREAENPDMMVVVIQVTGGPHAGLAEICEAQRRFVIEDGKSILVSAVGCELKSDFWHLNRNGALELGRQVGRALLKTVYDQEDVNWPGPVMDQAVLRADRHSVTAHFAEVATMSGCQAMDFAVMDSDGLLVQQRGIKAESGKTVVTVEFETEIHLPAKLMYGSRGYPLATLKDEAGNRAPAVQIDLTSNTLPPDRTTLAANGAK